MAQTFTYYGVNANTYFEGDLRVGQRTTARLDKCVHTHDESGCRVAESGGTFDLELVVTSIQEKDGIRQQGEARIIGGRPTDTWAPHNADLQEVITSWIGRDVRVSAYIPRPLDEEQSLLDLQYEGDQRRFGPSPVFV